MTEKSEKLVKIILPDLLNYLGMVESGEIIERLLENNLPHKQKEEPLDNKISKSINKKIMISK